MRSFQQRWAGSGRRLLLTALLLLLVLTGCAGAGTPAAQPTPGGSLDPQASEVSASGEVAPARWASLSFAAGASNLELLVKVGDRVTKGQELVKSDDLQYRAALAQAQSAQARAEAALNQLKDSPTAAALAAAEAALASAKANQARLEDTDAKQADLDAAKAQVSSAQAALDELKAGPAQAQLDSAEKDLSAAQVAVEQAQAALANASLVAPFDAQVIEIYANASEPASPAQPVLLLADPSSYQVETTDLSEVDLARVKVGAAARVVFDALPNQTFNGKVDSIALKSSGGSAVYYRVIVRLDANPPEVRWGMTAFVVFP